LALSLGGLRVIIYLSISYWVNFINIFLINSSQCKSFDKVSDASEGLHEQESNKITRTISYNNAPRKGLKHPYKKIEILNPFNNRSQIAECAKGARGVYLFEVECKNIKYIGSSINLYNRVCSYFLPSILARSDRKVLRYFNKYGFGDVKLTLFIMEPTSSWEQVIELEQYLIDTISPSLNVDLVAGGYYGYHTPMSKEARDILPSAPSSPTKTEEERGRRKIERDTYIYI